MKWKIYGLSSCGLVVNGYNFFIFVNEKKWKFYIPLPFINEELCVKLQELKDGQLNIFFVEIKVERKLQKYCV